MDGAGTERQERVAAGLGAGSECQDEKGDTLNMEHFVVDADAGGDQGDTGSSLLPAFPGMAIQEKVEATLGGEDRIISVKKVEEDGRHSTLQASGSSSQDSVVLDGQHDCASVCGQPSDFHSDMEAVALLPVVGLAQEPTGQSGSHEYCESYYPDRTEKEARENNGTDRSGICAEKASGGTAGAPCRQEEHGPAPHQSRCAPASAAAQQSYKGSSVLESTGSHDAAKEKKTFLENPQILPPVKKKPRTFYTAEQLEELEKMFQEDHYPDSEKRREIAAVVGVTPQRILVWFQNRRAKWRKLEKLSAKGNTKYPTSSAVSVPFGSDGYGAPPLPMTLLPDAAYDQSAMLEGDTGAGNSSSLLSTHPAASASASSVAEMVASCEAVQTQALPQLPVNSSGMECFPRLPSPPPIRRANLPFSPHSHSAPLVLDTPSTECSLSSQESGSGEAFGYGIQNQGFSSPVSCLYPEQLEPAGNLETSYCQYSSQEDIYQLSQLSQFCPLPGPLASNVLSSDQLPPPTPPESHPAFPAFPGDSGAITYRATQSYAPNHMRGLLMPQQPAGNSADITAYPAVPWSDFYIQGALFSDQLHSQMPFSSMAGGQYFTEPHLLQVPSGTPLESMPQPGKQKGVTPPDQSSYQSHQTEPELALLAEKEDIESSSKKGETVVVETKEETND